jgi:hypothetical protein
MTIDEVRAALNNNDAIEVSIPSQGVISGVFITAVDMGTGKAWSEASHVWTDAELLVFIRSVPR